MSCTATSELATLELKITSPEEDVPAFVFKTNANFKQLEQYINTIKACVESISANPPEISAGAVLTQARKIRLVNGANHVSIGSHIYNPGSADEYAITYSISGNEHLYILAHSSDVSNAIVRVINTATGETVYPQVITSGVNMSINFNRPLAIDEIIKIIFIA